MIRWLNDLLGGDVRVAIEGKEYENEIGQSKSHL